MGAPTSALQFVSGVHFEVNLLINSLHPTLTYTAVRSLSVEVRIFQIKLNQKTRARCEADTLSVFTSRRQTPAQSKNSLCLVRTSQAQQQVPGHTDPSLSHHTARANADTAGGCLCSCLVLILSTYGPENSALSQEQIAISVRRKSCC